MPLYHLAGFYEPFAAISHLLGVALFFILGLALIRRAAGDRAKAALFALYAVANMLQFLMSGFYHMTVRGSAANELFGRLDHAAVFLSIVGVFTPIYSLCYRRRQRRLLLATVWIPAICGILFTTVFANDAAEGLRLALYQAMGWSSIVVLVDLWRRFGFTFVWPIMAGGAMISVAALTQHLGWPTLIPGVLHAHETFHVILLIGSVHQWQFLCQLSDRRFTVSDKKPRSVVIAAPGISQPVAQAA
jgi:hemolysin III